MITEDEINQRMKYYAQAVHVLTQMHHGTPTVTETILYVSVILKEDPIELAIAIYKIEEEKKQDEALPRYEAQITPVMRDANVPL